MTIINDYCGGILEGKEIKRIIPGGSSMPPLQKKKPLKSRWIMNHLKQSVLPSVPQV